jgi:hypothetical protein
VRTKNIALASAEIMELVEEGEKTASGTNVYVFVRTSAYISIQFCLTTFQQSVAGLSYLSTELTFKKMKFNQTFEEILNSKQITQHITFNLFCKD